MTRIFVLRSLKEALGDAVCLALKLDFFAYKATGVLSDRFGRDARYHIPAEAVLSDLFHLHIDTDNQWSPKAAQFDRTSDTHLVYCRGFFNPDYYALIAFLDPSAHAQARSMDVMARLIQAADAFRKMY